MSKSISACALIESLLHCEGSDRISFRETKTLSARSVRFDVEVLAWGECYHKQCTTVCM